MINATLKILNLEKYRLLIKSLDISKIDNTIYCYITLNNQHDKCPLCNNAGIVKEYVNKKIVHSISNNNPCIIIYKARRFYS